MGFFGRFFGNEYDRDYGHRRDSGNMRDWGYGAGVWGNANRDSGRFGYDRNFQGSGTGYDRNFFGNRPTNYGDAYGDRSYRNPMRTTRGDYGSNYDQGFFGAGHDRHTHDRNWSGGRGMHFEPEMERGRWGSREGSWTRGYDRSGRGGYDGGWF